jgi:hypothetical protein
MLIQFTVLRRLQPLRLRRDPARHDQRRRLQLRAVHRHSHQPAVHHRHQHLHPVLVRQAEQAHLRHREHICSLQRLGQARLRQQELQLPGHGCRGLLRRRICFHHRVLDGIDRCAGAASASLMVWGTDWLDQVVIVVLRKWDVHSFGSVS